MIVFRAALAVLPPSRGLPCLAVSMQLLYHPVSVSFYVVISYNSRQSIFEGTPVKIILSRKGFDASVGKAASPIFPSGELCSLPIPEPGPGGHAKRYEEIRIGSQSLGTIVNDLTEGKVKPDSLAHLDPDLNMASVPRLANWKPVFRQAGAAARHLLNHGVKEGDVFVFYGWFRQVEQVAGRYRYLKSAADMHVN